MPNMRMKVMVFWTRWSLWMRRLVRQRLGRTVNRLAVASGGRLLVIVFAGARFNLSDS
jgi:hypothetical protein